MKNLSIIASMAFILNMLCSVSWAVTPPPKSGEFPIAHIKESIICCPGDSVTFDGWASIVAHGEIVKWLWDLNGDGKIDTICSSGELRFKASNKYHSSRVILRVRDNHGNESGPDTSAFHIMDSPPIAQVGGDTTIKVGVRISFSPVIISNCSKIARYEWYFNDEAKPSFKSELNGNTSRIYYKSGRYYARFHTIDEMGREAGGLKIITVQ